MKVYVVIDTLREQILGVFSTRVKASLYIEETYSPSYVRNIYVECLVVDEAKP